MIKLLECPCCNRLVPEGDCKTELTKRITRVLGASLVDPGYKEALGLLDLEEIKFCIRNEGRKHGQRMIRNELRSRGCTGRELTLIYEAVDFEYNQAKAVIQ